VSKKVRGFRRRVSEERGFALVMALAVVVVLGTSVGSMVVYTSSNYGHASRSRADQIAVSLAEAGLNTAYSTLEHSSSPGAQAALSPTPVPDITMVGGTTSYDGVYDVASKTWTLTGIGKAPDPAATGHTIVRFVHGKARIGTGTIGGASNAAWKYIYSDDPASCASLSNNTSIDVPLYVRGSLCLYNSAIIDGPALQVGGRVTLNNTQTRVGSVTSPMAEVHIAGGCSLTGVVYDTPCTAADRVYGTTVDTTLTPLSKPPVDLAGSYQNAMPGPKHACTSLSGNPPSFDNNGTMDESLPTVNLTPRTAYDCTVRDASGAIVGQIAWTPGAPGSLIVKGTIFFDGSVTFSGLTQLLYQGRATIVASGTISLQNQTLVCPVGGCADPNWDPNTQNLLAFVAGSLKGEQVGFSIGNYSDFTGAVYCVNDYTSGNNSHVRGPVIARQISISNSTFNDFPPIWNLMPGMPSTYSTVTTVSVVQGSWS
jgi:hypothetical protein